MLIDAVFSFDSVITAGEPPNMWAMIAAVVIVAMIVMFPVPVRPFPALYTNTQLSKCWPFPSLVMIGLSLVIEGWDHEQVKPFTSKNYIYFGMAFSFGMEMLNMTMRSRDARKSPRS